MANIYCLVFWRTTSGVCQDIRQLDTYRCHFGSHCNLTVSELYGTLNAATMYCSRLPLDWCRPAELQMIIDSDIHNLGFGVSTRVQRKPKQLCALLCRMSKQVDPKGCRRAPGFESILVMGKKRAWCSSKDHKTGEWAPISGPTTMPMPLVCDMLVVCRCARCSRSLRVPGGSDQRRISSKGMKWYS